MAQKINVLVSKSLTQLQLCDARGREQRYAAGDSEPTLPPQLQQLSRLQCLKLADGRLIPGVLASMRELTQLKLFSITLLPHDAASGLPQPAALSAFLGAMQCLTALQHLSLETPLYSAEMAATTDTALLQQFSSLTASSKLTALSFAAADDAPLPPGSLQQMFPAGKQLPHMRTLGIDFILNDELACFGVDDLACIFTACPGLAELQLESALEPVDDADFSPLLQLPQSCTRLVVGGEAFDDEAAGVIAQLGQLKLLKWLFSEHLTKDGVSALTALKGLEHLEVTHCPEVYLGKAYGWCHEYPDPEQGFLIEGNGVTVR